MHNIIQNFLNLPFVTYENATFLIAFAGLLLSIYNFIHEKRQNRMKLTVTYKSHFISEHDHAGITISMAIENLVSIPISISRMFLNINDEKIEFYWMPQFVFRATLGTNDQISDEINIHTLSLPQTIEGYGVLGGFFYVKHPRLISDELLLSSRTSITIHSNKGIKTYPILMDNTSREH